MSVLNTVDPTDGSPIEIGIDPFTGALAFPQWQAEKQRGALDKVPVTFDQQSGLGYQFAIKRMPNVNYFVHRVNVPGVTLPPAPRSTPFIEMPTPGDHIQYEPLVLEFRVDVLLKNYFELHGWLSDISGIRGGEAYAKRARIPEPAPGSVQSEINVSLLNGQKNVIRNIVYHNAWPTQLTGMYFTADQQNIQYLAARATFLFIYYETTTDV
jgi:hypothetical protein